ncbi:MAG: hypothetical protein ABIQ02_05600 [Saprospiraceae bacterium]
MPVWVQFVIAAAAFVTASGVLIKKVIIPVFHFAKQVDDLLPKMVELTEQLSHQPDSAKILAEIVGQLRTDSGSSLLDIIKRLEETSKINTANNSALFGLMTSLGVRVDAGAATGLRNEDTARLRDAAAEKIAADLKIAQDAVDEVAAELAASHKRADDIDTRDGNPGDAADAASRSPQ